LPNPAKPVGPTFFTRYKFLRGGFRCIQSGPKRRERERERERERGRRRRRRRRRRKEGKNWGKT